MGELKDYLEQKIAIHQTIQSKAELPKRTTLRDLLDQEALEEQYEANNHDPELIRLREQTHALADFIGQLDQDHEQDTVKLTQVNSLLDNLRSLRSGSPSDDIGKLLSQTREGYLALRQGNLHNHELSNKPAESARAFAKYMRHTAASDYKHMRGTLLETEMQATMARKLYNEGVAQSQLSSLSLH